ncbi:MAG: hypothetical protein HY735_14890 [Verrucomicrobia bacterium]|nr:hypothetical protein [Verrucomicrobiota bacterium]
MKSPAPSPSGRPDTLPNPASYLDAFQRRLERGRWFYTPCLSWKGFVPGYVRV